MPAAGFQKKADLLSVDSYAGSQREDGEIYPGRAAPKKIISFARPVRYCAGKKARTYKNGRKAAARESAFPTARLSRRQSVRVRVRTPTATLTSHIKKISAFQLHRRRKRISPQVYAAPQPAAPTPTIRKSFKDDRHLGNAQQGSISKHHSGLSRKLCRQLRNQRNQRIKLRPCLSLFKAPVA